MPIQTPTPVSSPSSCPIGKTYFGEPNFSASNYSSITPTSSNIIITNNKIKAFALSGTGTKLTATRDASTFPLKGNAHVECDTNLYIDAGSTWGGGGPAQNSPSFELKCGNTQLAIVYFTGPTIDDQLKISILSLGKTTYATGIVTLVKGEIYKLSVLMDVLNYNGSGADIAVWATISDSTGIILTQEAEYNFATLGVATNFHCVIESQPLFNQTQNANDYFEITKLYAYGDGLPNACGPTPTPVGGPSSCPIGKTYFGEPNFSESNFSSILPASPNIVITNDKIHAFALPSSQKLTLIRNTSTLPLKGNAHFECDMSFYIDTGSTWGGGANASFELKFGSSQLAIIYFGLYPLKIQIQSPGKTTYVTDTITVQKGIIYNCTIVLEAVGYDAINAVVTLLISAILSDLTGEILSISRNYTPINLGFSATNYGIEIKSQPLFNDPANINDYFELTKLYAYGDGLPNNCLGPYVPPEPSAYTRPIVIDAGAIYKNYGLPNQSLLGATRGGNKFAVDTEIVEVKVDGAKGPVQGEKRIRKVNAYIETNIIEFSSELLRMALPGSTILQTDTHYEISRAAQIALSDYADNVTIVGEVRDREEPIVCGILNALAEGNFSLSLSDNDEAVLKIRFGAHCDLNDLDSEPWFIRMASDV